MSVQRFFTYTSNLFKAIYYIKTKGKVGHSQKGSHTSSTIFSWTTMEIVKTRVHDESHTAKVTRFILRL